MDEPFSIADLNRPITRDDLAGLATDEWPLYRKKVPIHAARVNEPFTVATSEGLLKCEDGWLCIDARGYPYPVADAEFQLIYEPAGSVNGAREKAIDTLIALLKSSDESLRLRAAEYLLGRSGN